MSQVPQCIIRPLLKSRGSGTRDIASDTTHNIKSKNKRGIEQLKRRQDQIKRENEEREKKYKTEGAKKREKKASAK